MTRDRIRSFIDAVVKMREIATDTQAIEIQSIYPTWKEGVQYVAGERVLYDEILYKVLTTHLSQADWTPDVAFSLFAKVLVVDENTITEWEQPNSTNPYMMGDKVVYNGKTYVSTIDNNVWSPDAYGWDEI